MLKGADLVIDFATPGIQKLFGNRECLGLPVAQAWPEIEQQGLTNHMLEVYQTGRPLHFRKSDEDDPVKRPVMPDLMHLNILPNYLSSESSRSSAATPVA